MFRKLALGLVAAASLSAAAFTPTAASAHGFGFGGPVVESCIVVTPYGRVINVCY